MKTPKIITIFLIASLPLLFSSSCKEVKDAAAVTVSYDLPAINFIYYPTTLKAEEVVLYSGMVLINLDSLLNAHGLSGGVVGATYLTQFTLTIDDPDSATFSWLASARAQFAQDANFQTAVEVATAVNNDPNAKVLALTTNNVNIRQYLGSTAFYIRVYATLNGPVPYEWIGMYINSQLKLTLEPLA